MFIPENRVKQYVDVIVQHRDDGGLRPLTINLLDGRSYQIKEVIGHPVPDSASATHKRTIRYTVRVGSKRTWIYNELSMDNAVPTSRWYIAARPTTQTQPVYVDTHYNTIAQ